MKKINLLILFFTALFFTSCEEVVDVDLKTEPPKLVVEAVINWTKGTTGNQQMIKLTTTADYYNPQIPVVSGATVSIKNSTNKVFTFIEIPKTGQYVCTNFEPVINETYVLTIISGGNTYTATETLKSVASITRIEQKNDGGIMKDEIEVKAYFNDPTNETNYYLYHYTYSNKILSSYSAVEDRFFNGNEFFSSSNNDDLKTGDQVEISHIGISKSYYNYMNILISIAGDNSGGPFQSPPATVRGNVINTTNASDYPLGYFSLGEIDTKKYTIE